MSERSVVRCNSRSYITARSLDTKSRNTAYNGTYSPQENVSADHTSHTLGNLSCAAAAILPVQRFVAGLIRQRCPGSIKPRISTLTAGSGIPSLPILHDLR